MNWKVAGVSLPTHWSRINQGSAHTLAALERRGSSGDDNERRERAKVSNRSTRINERDEMKPFISVER